jgi:protocatechuate 3,4-dioxygenase beta subunit
MLARRRTNRLTALGALFVAGLVILPPVVALAVDQEQEIKTASGGQQSASEQAAILRGRVTNEGGDPLADVRVRVVAVADLDRRVVEDTTLNKRLEARSDVKGDYRLELHGITKRTRISIDAMKPGYRRLRGTPMAGGDAKPIEVAPGSIAEASLMLRPALYFAGTIVDEQGRPLRGVRIEANAHSPRATGGIERTVSGSDGSFELFNYPETPPSVGGAVSKGVVHFAHPDYIDREIEDIYAVRPKERGVLQVVLGTGYRITGTVFDPARKPVPNAMIKAIRKDTTHRKATLTDAKGNFVLRGVSGGLIMLTARALDIRQQTYLPLALKSDKENLEVQLKPIAWPIDLKKHSVLGLQLTDVTPELRSTYDLFHERGALILDPGKDPDRLKIGPLAEGDTFWMVGRTRIGSVREFVGQILAETAGQNAAEYSVRVVYGFSRVDFDGSRTAYLRFTNEDREQLQMLSDQLTPESP